MSEMKKRVSYSISSSCTQLLGWLPYLISSYFLGADFSVKFNLVQRAGMVCSFSIALNSVSAPKLSEAKKRMTGC